MNSKIFDLDLQTQLKEAYKPRMRPSTLQLLLGVFISAAVLSMNSTAVAREIRFNDIILDATDAQKIIVTGFKGSLKLTPSKQPNKIVIHAKKTVDDKKQASDDRWTFGAKHEEKIIKIEVRGPDSQTSGDELKLLTTEFQFEIEAPSLPFDIAWREGSINIQNWNSSLNIVLLDGNLVISHSNASVHLQNESGETKILNHKGRVEIESLKAKIFVTDFEGNLRIKNFAGETLLENLSASVRLQTKMGNSHLTKSQGSLELENGKGAVNILDFSGQIRGQDEDGSITAKILGDVDVSLESTSGAMSFKLPATSAAYAKIQSEDGQLSTPESFKTGKLANLKVASGRFTGSEKGSILLKSKTGNLRVH